MNEKVTLPGLPMTEQQQTQTLQKMGLDFLSSIHWIIIIIVAVLFAGLLVFVKKRKEATKEKEAEENNKIIEQSARELDEYYFLPDGQLNPDAIPMPQRFKNGIPPEDDKQKECTTFAEDDVNKRINTALSPNILQQLRRFAKSGGLFSFLNSTISAKDRLQQELEKGVSKPVISEEQKIAMSLRSRFGGDQLRNPLINSQIKNEILHRREQNAAAQPVNVAEEEKIGQGNLNEQQLNLLEKAFQQN